MSKKKKKATKFLNGNYALLPILFVLCIVPLIMRVHIYYPGLKIFKWFSESSQAVDIFLHGKAVALVAAAVCMVIILVISVIRDRKSRTKDLTFDRLKKAKWLIPLAAFGLLALLSTLFSEYRSYGFSGIYEQFESIWVILSYCIVAIYTFYFVRSKEDIDILRKGLFVVLTVFSIIGLTQLTGHDIWQTDFGKSFYIPSEYSHLKDSFSFNFSGSGTHQVYLTLYNPNYVGVFAALILPISIMLCLGGKALSQKIAWGILSILIFLCALGSGSKAFLLSLMVTVGIGVVFFACKNIKYIPVVIVMLAIFIIAARAYASYADIDIVKYVSNALTPTENAYDVEDFIINKDCVTLKYNGSELSVACDSTYFGTEIRAWDENGTEIAYSFTDNTTVLFNDERFSNIVMTVNSSSEASYVADLTVAGKKFSFSKTSEGYTYINCMGKADTIETADSAIFTKYDRLFSDRGYLWSRTIPLLKDSLILGSGADTFSLVFPQNDYVARTNAGYRDLLITKPHSLYLQSAVQYGVPAFICYITVFAIYIIQTFILCLKAKFKNGYCYCALGVLLGIIGYCIMGISNDSSIVLAPMAWVIIGLGFAVNTIIKKETE